MGLFSRKSDSSEETAANQVQNASAPVESSDVPLGFIARAKAIGADNGFSYEHGGSEGDEPRLWSVRKRK